MMNVFWCSLALAALLVYETIAEDVKVYMVPSLKIVELTFPSSQHLVLSCPLAQQVRISSAAWIPISDNAAERNYYFDRTKHLSDFCRSFENCAFRPVSHTMDLQPPFEFLGKPVETDSYKLVMKLTCIHSYFTPSSKTVQYSLDAKDKPTLRFGCDVGEQIRLSYVRASGRDTRPLTKGTLCYKSVIDKAHLMCSGKRICSVPWDVFERVNDGCDYAEVSVKYHCAKQQKNQFFDPLETCDEEKDVWNFTLSAEEGAQIITTAHAHRVLNVVSAVWESQQSADDSCKRRDRSALLKFLCQGQASCSFIPTRAIIGPDQRRCMNVLFGGIVHTAHANFILRAHLELTRFDKIDYDQPPYVHIISAEREPITIKCEGHLVPQVAIALWGGEYTGSTMQNASDDFDAVIIDAYRHHYQDFSNLFNRLCFGQKECTINPLDFERLPGETLTSLPWYKGVAKTDHVLNVYYKCVDYSRAPSLVGSDKVEAEPGSFAQTVQVPPGLVTGEEERYPKEFIRPVALSQDTIITAILQVHGNATLKIADVIHVEIPFNENGGTMTVLWQGGELKSDIHVKEAHKDYVFEFIVGSPEYIQLTVNAFDKQGKPIKSTIDLEAEEQVLDFTSPVNDLVLALGNVTSLRAFYRAGV